MFPYLVAVALAAPTPAANESVVKFRTLTAVCDDYAKALAEALGNESLAVGRVTAPFGLATGAGVEAELTVALERVNKPVGDKATHEIRGDVSYEFVPAVTKPGDNDDGSQKLAVIRFRVIDNKNGQEVAAAGRAYAVTHLDEIARLLGITAKLDADTTAAEHYRTFEKAVSSPKVATLRSLVKAALSSRCPIEIFVWKDEKLEAQTVERQDGQAFVKLAKGDRFVVKLNNPTDGDIGARLVVDGVDGYHFAERKAGGRPFAQIYHVPPKNGLMMMGWTLTGTRWDDFRVGPTKVVTLPPVRESKWGSVTLAISNMVPNPNQPGRLLTEAPLEFLTIRLAR
jgi:hypothetical protein